MTETIFVTLKKIVSAYNIFLIITGTIGNIFTICIFMKKEFRMACFRLYIFNIIYDTFGLYHWNIRQFFLYYWNIDYQNVYLFYCSFTTYAQISCFEISAWFLVRFNLNYFFYIKLILKKKFKGEHICR